VERMSHIDIAGRQRQREFLEFMKEKLQQNLKKLKSILRLPWILSGPFNFT
jgi:hypothetical protein